LGVETKMLISTDMPVTPDTSLSSDPVSRRQGGGEKFKPVVRVLATTIPTDPTLSGDTELTGSQLPHKRFEPPVAMSLLPTSAHSTPLQIWEGTVLKIDRPAGVMHVVLEAKIGQMPRHTGEIGLEWVAEQDEDLLRPGAVFYLTLFKTTQRGSVRSSQELRFRRRPSWSAAQLKRVEEDAAMLLSKMKVLPAAG
jgi:hypothetical protein